MNIPTLATIGLAAVAVVVLAGAASGRASAAATSLPHISSGRVILDFQPHHIQPRAASTGSTSVRRFTRTVTDGGAKFSVTMVGKNPFVTQTAP